MLSQPFTMQDLHAGRFMGTAIINVIDIKTLAITISQSFEIALGASLIIIRVGVLCNVDK